MFSFLKQAILYPKYTGALFPSSKWLINATIKLADLKSAKAIVELGPGTGAVTKEILRNTPKNALFFAIEKNHSFVKIAKNRCPNAVIYNDSATAIKKYLSIHNKKTCDRIFSELPWTSFEENLQSKILDVAYKSLDIGGIFLTSAYIPFAYSTSGKRFKKMLDRHFSIVSTTKIIWRNIPPAVIYVCKK